MLRFTAISMSLLFLLILGAGNSAKASTDLSAKAGVGNESQSTEKQSGEEGKLGDSQDKAMAIDFFGVFSLMNVQLQWRDLYVSYSEEIVKDESLIKRLGVEQEAKTTELYHAGNTTVAPVTVAASPMHFLTAETQLKENTSFKTAKNQQIVRTIAYILNCGTYL